MPASALMNIMMGAVRKAGRGLTRDFGEVEQLQVSQKGPANFVTAADHRSEEVLYRELSKARPGYGFLMEERGAVDGPDKSHRWLVDPLDGTTNFLHGIPIFSISVALEREGEIVAGIVYNPILDELCSAERGAGAFVNNRRLRVAARKSLTDAVIATGIPHRGRGDRDRFMREAGALMEHVAGIRRSGSATTDLAWVAAGRLDGYFEHQLAPWDIAAGLLLVREAGGLVTDFEGAQNPLATGSVVAANAAIHKALIGTLHEAAAPAA